MAASPSRRSPVAATAWWRPGEASAGSHGGSGRGGRRSPRRRGRARRHLAGRSGGAAAGIVTQVDQLGDRIAIVQVQGAGASAAADAARASTVRWTLVALGVALVPLLGVGWVLAGRLTPAAGGDLDDTECADATAALDGEAEQLRAQRDRDRRHLQEVVHELRTPLAVAATNLDLAVTTPGWTPTSAATSPPPAAASSGWLARSTIWPRTGACRWATTAPSTSPSRSGRWPASTVAWPRPAGSRCMSGVPTGSSWPPIAPRSTPRSATCWPTPSDWPRPARSCGWPPAPGTSGRGSPCATRAPACPTSITSGPSGATGAGATTSTGTPARAAPAASA